MELIFATKNAGKLREIRACLDGLDVLSMEEAGITADIEETGATFEENAIIKAKAVMEQSGRIALGDDSGLCVEWLGGAPGVMSARYMGEDTPYDVKNARILELLKDVPREARAARFVCCIAAAFPEKLGGGLIVTHGVIEGIIAEEPAGKGGFGYDPIFFVPEFNMTTAEMLADLKNTVSHRGRALRRMRDRLALRLAEG